MQHHMAFVTPREALKGNDTRSWRRRRGMQIARAVLRDRLAEMDIQRHEEFEIVSREAYRRAILFALHQCDLVFREQPAPPVPLTQNPHHTLMKCHDRKPTVAQERAQASARRKPSTLRPVPADP